MRPVLMGGRAVSWKSPVLGGVSVWLPVVVMLALIARESTPMFAAEHTTGILRSMWQAMFGPVSDQSWATVHYYMRKSGHFMGYGLLGLTWLRAWLLTWMPLLRLKSAAYYRGMCVVMAVLCTMAVASVDELHQTYLPDRTGLMSDVLLDTMGAAVLMAMVSLSWIGRAQPGVDTCDARA